VPEPQSLFVLVLLDPQDLIILQAQLLCSSRHILGVDRNSVASVNSVNFSLFSRFSLHYARFSLRCVSFSLHYSSRFSLFALLCGLFASHVAPRRFASCFASGACCSAQNSSFVSPRAACPYQDLNVYTFLTQEEMCQKCVEISVVKSYEKKCQRGF